MRAQHAQNRTSHGPFVFAGPVSYLNFWTVKVVRFSNISHFTLQRQFILDQL